MTRPLADLIHDSGLPPRTWIVTLKDPKVTSAPLTWHITKPLTAACLHMLSDLTNYTDQALLELPGFGVGRLEKLTAAILGAATKPVIVSERQLLIDAVTLVVADGPVSESILQRRLRIGYAAAACLVGDLEAIGVISPRDDRDDRRILITPDEVDATLDKIRAGDL